MSKKNTNQFEKFGLKPIKGRVIERQQEEIDQEIYFPVRQCYCCNDSGVILDLVMMMLNPDINYHISTHGEYRCDGCNIYHTKYLADGKDLIHLKKIYTKEECIEVSNKLKTIWETSTKNRQEMLIKSKEAINHSFDGLFINKRDDK